MNQYAISKHYQSQRAIFEISDYLLSVIPFEHNELIFCCIGTDRSTGDALGPLVGTQLQNNSDFPFPIIGTLSDPLHALNLKERLQLLKSQYDNPFIVAVDACLSEQSRVGHIVAQQGPLFPGKALQKKLPPVGNISIKGVVNVGGFMDATILQNTRLFFTYEISTKITEAILFAWERHLLKGEHNSYYDRYYKQAGQ